MSKEIITYQLKSFNHSCCIKWLKHNFTESNIEIINIDFGMVSVYEDDKQKAKEIIDKAGFVIIEDKNLIKVEAIKQAVFEIVHLHNNQNSIIQKSEYLIERLGMSYPSISKLFSRYSNITLEKFIIKHKIEKIKELIESEDYTLSEIAYIMDYSSVQHLSNQFKKETGYSFTDFKLLENKVKIDLNSI
jgi:AraC-like DNA-binding protein